MANEAKDSMRRRYKLRKNCAKLITGNSMLEYAREMLGGAGAIVSKGNTMVAA